MIVVFVMIGYVLMGGITYGILLYLWRHDNLGILYADTAAGGMFWPLTILLLIGNCIGRVVNYLLERIFNNEV